MIILRRFKDANMLLNTVVELSGYNENAFIYLVAVVLNLTSRWHSVSISLSLLPTKSNTITHIQKTTTYINLEC